MISNAPQRVKLRVKNPVLPHGAFKKQGLVDSLSPNNPLERMPFIPVLPHRVFWHNFIKEAPGKFITLKLISCHKFGNMF